MISGITQSLNSGFSQGFNTSLTSDITPSLTSDGLGTPGSTFTSSLTPSLTPSLSSTLTPSLTPNLALASVPSYMRSVGATEPGNFMHLKHMQIKKPLMKSSLADPSMTEEEVNLKFVQDLLNWVEEMQVSSFSILLHICYNSLLIFFLRLVATRTLRVGNRFAHCGNAFRQPQECAQSHRRISHES